jgi:hypothetical protein
MADFTLRFGNSLSSDCSAKLESSVLSWANESLKECKNAMFCLSCKRKLPHLTLVNLSKDISSI